MGIRMSGVGLGPRAFRVGKSLLLMAFALAIATAALIADSASSAATFTVTSTGTAADADPGNGVCANSNRVCTLRAAIHEANALEGPDTIQLPAGTYPISPPATQPNDILTGDLDIVDDLTINGAGSASTIISGGRRDRVFEVSTSADVTINDLTVRGGSHPQVGAGIMNAEGGTVTVAGSVLQANKAAKFGGGVANAQSGTVRLVDRTRLSTNSAGEAGSAVANLAAGSIEITQSTISANSSALGGAAISNTGISPNAGSITLSRATVKNNVAGSGTNPGGGISNARGGTMIIDRSTITDNRSAADGGGIANTGFLTVEQSTISGNRSAADGGGIANTGGGTAAVVGSTISDNRADGDTTDGGESNGGGITTDGGALTVASSTFSNNLTTGEGGGIQNTLKGGLTVTGSTFSGNSALDGGGIYTSGDAGASVSSSTLSGNKASRNGGGLNNNGTTAGALTVQDVTFSGNQATADGGGLILEGGSATIANSDFADNSADSGGGFANHSGGVVSVADSTFTGNTAQGAGGGIENLADGPLTVTHSQISGNQASHGGGIENVADAGFTLTHSQVSGNQASFRGGGVENLSDAAFMVAYSEVSGNQAAHGAGFGSDSDSSYIVENSTISGNVATVEGGGLLVLAPVTLASNTIAHNSAPLGGGLRKVGDSRVLMRNTIIANNEGGNCSLEEETRPIDSEGGNLDSGVTCGLTHLTDISGVDPLLGPLQDNGGGTATHALDPLSLARDTAVSSICPPDDQRGVSRPQHDGCDIGSYEYDGAAPPLPCTARATLTFTAAADSWVNEHDPNKNFGTDQALKVRSAVLGATGNSRALVRFDLPPLPPRCQVLAATLRLNAGGFEDNRVIEAVAIESTWTEGEVSWNNQPPTVGGASTIISAHGNVHWDVTAQVQGMYSSGESHGFMIRDAAENDIAAEQSFYSREAGKNPPPQLVVSFG
jgi:hypothetical protein